MPASLDEQIKNLPHIPTDRLRSALRGSKELMHKLPPPARAGFQKAIDAIETELKTRG